MCIHVGGGEANTQANEAVLRAENRSSKLITWKDRTECELHCSYHLTVSETLRQAARVNTDTAELPVPPPLQRARLQPGRRNGEAAGSGGTGAGLVGLRGLCVGLLASARLLRLPHLPVVGGWGQTGLIPVLPQPPAREPEELQPCCLQPRCTAEEAAREESLPFTACSVFLCRRNFAKAKIHTFKLPSGVNNSRND